ncbi:hypothetical protein F4860DRAFT_480620 [Xylaria cubensis]|nr:hypothetical protein F4860DRAFT_480620 [Xylaria cubensis]
MPNYHDPPMLPPSDNVGPITNPKESLNTPFSTNDIVSSKSSPVSRAHSSPTDLPLSKPAGLSSRPILPQVLQSTNDVCQSAYMPSLSCHFNHSSLKPCGKHFADEGMLRQHLKKSHRFLCERGCTDTGFVSSRDLERHYNTAIHRQDCQNGLFVCGSCSLAQARHDNHFRHIRQCGKNDSMSYKCGRCDNQTSSKTEHLHHWETKCRKK